MNRELSERGYTDGEISGEYRAHYEQGREAKSSSRGGGMV